MLRECAMACSRSGFHVVTEAHKPKDLALCKSVFKYEDVQKSKRKKEREKRKKSAEDSPCGVGMYILDWRFAG
jgi:hypothetical protein